MQRSIAIALAALPALALLSTPAMASEHGARHEVRISYADLDLTTQRGADRLLRRVHRAARVACGVSYGKISLLERQQVRACMVEAADRAVAQIDSPAVLARYIERTGRDPRLSIVVASTAAE
jgi:UrcA family protein